MGFPLHLAPLQSATHISYQSKPQKCLLIKMEVRMRVRWATAWGSSWEKVNCVSGFNSDGNWSQIYIDRNNPEVQAAAYWLLRLSFVVCQ